MFRKPPFKFTLIQWYLGNNEIHQCKGVCFRFDCISDWYMCLFVQMLHLFIFDTLYHLNPAEFIKVKWIQTLFLRLLVHLPVSCRQMSSRTPPWTFLSFMFGSSAAYVCVSGRSLTHLTSLPQSVCQVNACVILKYHFHFSE